MSVGKIQKQSKADYQTAAVKAKEGAQQVASEFANFVANFAASFEKYGDFKASLQKQQHLDDAQLAVFLRDQTLTARRSSCGQKKSRCLVAAPKKKKKKAVACSCLATYELSKPQDQDILQCKTATKLSCHFQTCTFTHFCVYN